MIIFNDTHLGAVRRSGATKESSASSSRWQIQQFKQLLHLAKDKTVLINGDLFDKFEVSKQVEIETFTVLKDWVDTYKNRLILSAGNHDLSTNSEKISSFENLCTYLVETCPEYVTVVQGSFQVYEDIAIIPHMPNQELFQQELDKVLELDGVKAVFVHANLMSPFAVHTDHSLNVSEEYLNKFKDKGMLMVFAHEHNSRKLPGAVVVGNQIPTSVSDCLDDNGKKFYAEWKDGKLELHEFLNLLNIYEQFHWQEKEPPVKHFLRVHGTATVEESAEVVKKIASFRNNSDAFVITNAVKIEGITELNTDEVTLEGFNVFKKVLESVPKPLVEMFKKVAENE